MRLESCACRPSDHSQPLQRSMRMLSKAEKETAQGRAVASKAGSRALELVENDGAAQEVPVIGDLDAAMLPRALHILPCDGLGPRLLPPEQRFPASRAYS